MKRMYRIFSLFLLFIILLGITAQADMIITPQNDFYLTHKKECVQYERTHYINAKRGALAVYDVPGGRGVLDTLQNAEEVLIRYTYDDGKWGLVHYIADRKHIFGWIELKQTVLKYDMQSFLDEHADQLYDDSEYLGKKMLSEIEAGTVVYFYPLPGAAEPNKEIEFGPNSAILGYSNGQKFQFLYDDEDGRIWGYLREDKYAGHLWVCLSEPTNPNLPVVEYQTLNLYPASDIEFQSESLPMWLLPTCLVAGVAALSFVLILILKKKKSSG